MIKLIKRITDVAKKKLTKKVAKKPAKKVAKKVTKKVAKKAVKKVAKKVTKKVAKKVAKKAAKKVAKKVAKKITKKTAKKVEKKVESKKTNKTKKEAKEPVIVKLEPAPITTDIADLTDNDDDLYEDEETTETAPSDKTAEPSHLMTDEYNPDDEHEQNAFGYGWSYDEGLDSPEETDTDDYIDDEDAEYVKGKPVGFDLEGSDDDDDMY